MSYALRSYRLEAIGGDVNVTVTFFDNSNFPVETRYGVLASGFVGSIESLVGAFNLSWPKAILIVEEPCLLAPAYNVVNGQYVAVLPDGVGDLLAAGKTYQIGGGTAGVAVETTLSKGDYYFAPTGSGDGLSASNPAGPSSLSSLIAAAGEGSKFILRAGVYQMPAGLIINRPGIQIIGSGAADTAGPATRLLFGTSANQSVSFSGSGPYTATVSGTVKAVYFDDSTAWQAQASGRAQLLTRNSATPTTPGAGEWGQLGTTLYLGTNPAGRTVRIVTGTSSCLTLGSLADDVIFSGLEIGMTAAHGIVIEAAQGAGQVSPRDLLLENVSIYGTYDQTLASGSVANCGILCRVPMNIEARGLWIDLCDNDGINLKQMCRFDGDGVHIQRCGDDGASPHYGATLKLRNFKIQQCRFISGTDGNGITVYGGGRADLERGEILNPGGSGVLIDGSSTSNPWPGHVVMTDVNLSTNPPSTTNSINGVQIDGRGHLTAHRVTCNFFQNSTSGQGFGFRFNDVSLPGGNIQATLKDCQSFRCRAPVSCNKGSTGTFFVNASNFLHADHSTVNDISCTGVTLSGTTTAFVSGASTWVPTPKSFYVS
jgi:hypothetical protein